MKKITTLLGAVLLMISGTACGTEDGGGSIQPPKSDGGSDTEEPVTFDPNATLKIATWNIEGPSSTNSKNLGYWPNRREQVARVIKSEDFDIFGTQETTKEMLDDICKDLPAYKWIGSYRKDAPYVNAIIWKKNRFELLENGAFYYSETPDVPNTCWPDDDGQKDLNCLWAKFKDRKTGIEFYHFNTHQHANYKSGPEGALRDTLRCRDARILKDKIVKIAGDSFAFCSGDFNSTDAWYDNFTGEFLHDARPSWTELLKGGILLDARRLATKTKNDHESSIPGWDVTGTSQNDSKYDHIFMNASIAQDYEVTMYEVIKTGFDMTHKGASFTMDGKFLETGYAFHRNLSDHRPVSITVKFIWSENDEMPE